MVSNKEYLGWDKLNEKARRIKEADEILKNICLN